MAEKKHEWKKHEKALYVPKQAPVQLEVPEFKYIVLEGVGNPNNEEFSDAIGVEKIAKQSILSLAIFNISV